jgi:hypothetical protein
VDVIYPTILDSKLGAHASTRFRCDVILCLGFTIASTTLNRAMLKEVHSDSLYWEMDVAPSEMRRISATLAGFVR